MSSVNGIATVYVLPGTWGRNGFLPKLDSFDGTAWRTRRLCLLAARMTGMLRNRYVSAYADTMNWPTILTSVSSAVIVAVLAAFLNPRFQHAFWKKQKLREQRVSIAERFAALHGKLTPAAAEIDFSARFEEHALLALVQTLFEREDTIVSCTRLMAWLDSHPIRLDGRSPISVFMEAWTLRIDLLIRLFAEAFEISAESLETRGAVHSHVS